MSYYEHYDSHTKQHICLFCGNEMKKKWDHYDEFYVCDCEDFRK